MRTMALVLAFFGVVTPGVVPAQVPAPPPTRVGEIGLYGCARHADIVATWPARCPICRTVLSPVPPAGFARVSVNLGPLIGAESRRRDEEAQEARRKEEARRAEEWRERYSYYGYYPPGGYPYTYPQGYAYRYPYDYYYHPNMGQYGYMIPGYTYPPGGYDTPKAGQYYYDPSTGPYDYSPNAGQYQYMNPGYTYPNRPSAGRQRN